MFIDLEYLVLSWVNNHLNFTSYWIIKCGFWNNRKMIIWVNTQPENYYIEGFKMFNWHELLVRLLEKVGLNLPEWNMNGEKRCDVSASINAWFNELYDYWRGYFLWLYLMIYFWNLKIVNRNLHAVNHFQQMMIYPSVQEKELQVSQWNKS